MRLVLRPFGRMPVKHALAEAKELLAERPASDTLPSREPICPAHHCVEQQAYVVDHPRHDGMVYGHILADARFEAKLHGPQQSADKPASDLSAAIGLRVIGGGLLSGQLGEVFALDLRQLYDPTNERLNGRLVV